MTEAVPRRAEAGRGFDAGPLLFAAAALVLAILVVVPLGWLLVMSLQRPETGGLTLHNYLEAFTTSIYLRPILNSLILALCVASIAVLLGTPLAWLIARTDLPGRPALRALITAAFVTPSFIGAEAWILLAAPNSGWLNRAFVELTHAAHGPLNIFSLAGAIFVMALYNVPYTFTFVAGALELLPVDLEDASSTLGASAWRTMTSITLPLVAPAIIGGFIMSFLEALAEFGAPAFLLIPARTQVVTTQLYLFFQFPVRTELAAAYAMPLLGVTIGLLLLQRRILGRKKYAVVGGKGGRRRLIALGPWRWPLLATALLVPLCSVALPYLALLAASLSHVWNQGPLGANFTFYWYHWAIFDNAETRAAIGHSLLYGAAAATAATTIAFLVAYMTNRKLFPGAAVLGFICTAPFVVPGIVLAIGIYAAYSHRPILLYGTAAILIVAFTTRFLPIAYSNLNTMIGSVGPDLENAARTLGATRLRALFTITAPLLRRGILASWLLVFIPAIRELSSAIFLFTPRTATMTTQIYDFTDAGNYEAVATLAVVILAITLIIVSVAYRFLGRDFMDSPENLMARIDIAGLAKGYPGSKAGRAVDGIDLAITDGEVMALVGPSGCGKTTTLQLLAGFLRPDAGTIAVGDRVVSSAKAVVPPERRRMSLIFQSYAVWPHKTVFENVAYGLRVQKLGRSEIEDRVKRVLQTVRLTDLAQRYPGELSGGQQQRVALARAVVVEPETLLLDEPLSNLDANLREEMRFEIRRVHDTTGVTMVYVTHDQAEAMVAADRIAIMQHGRIAQVGSAREIYERPASTFVATFIGRTNTLEATLISPGLAEVNGVRLRVRDDAGAPANGPVTLCVRPHELRLTPALDGDAAAGYDDHGGNSLLGRIVRQTYLGDARDYLVAVGDAQVRVSAPPQDDHAVGSAVRLALPVDACRVVATG